MCSNTQDIYCQDYVRIHKTCIVKIMYENLRNVNFFVTNPRTLGQSWGLDLGGVWVLGELMGGGEQDNLLSLQRSHIIQAGIQAFQDLLDGLLLILVAIAGQ
jgi:hypothetical protein